MQTRPAFTVLLVLAVIGAGGFALFRSVVGSEGDNAQGWLTGVGSRIGADEISYPIVYAGDLIVAPEDVHDWAYFEPLFGRDRPGVNPAAPTVVGRREFRFDKPGEYYLLLNGSRPLRVVVLAPDEPVSESVLRVFDFLVANLLATQGQDKLLSEDPDAYTRQFFQSSEPGLLLCGPTLALFERLVQDRFHLPVRGVGYIGTFSYGGQISYSAHNTAEVYLPDKRKWVQFDLNNGFLVKWLSALEISATVRKAAGSGRALSPEEWAKIDWAPYDGVEPLRSVDPANSEATFRPGLVGTDSVREHWPALSHVLVGGPSYRSGRRFEAPGLPEDFDVYYATLHDDPLLIEASKRWAESWGLSVKVVSPREMKELLDAASASQIEAEAWLSRIHPAQAKRLETADGP